MRLLLTIILLITSCGLAAGQGREREGDTYLRLLLGEANAKSLAKADSGIRRIDRPLKIFIYTPEQGNVEAAFEEWLDGWNKSDGVRYGQVVRVTDASQADIILARFVSASALKPNE